MAKTPPGTSPWAAQNVKTRHRSVRVPDEIWHPALEVAKERGESVPEVIRAALVRYVKRARR